MHYTDDQLATPWQRIASAVIDRVIFLILFCTPLIIMLGIDKKEFIHQAKSIIDAIIRGQSLLIIIPFIPSMIIQIPGLLTSTLLAGGYLGFSMFLMAKYGQTVGQYLLNIKVIAIGGGNPGFARYVLVREFSIVYLNYLVTMPTNIVVSTLVTLFFYKYKINDFIVNIYLFGSFIGMFSLPITLIVLWIMMYRSQNRQTLQDWLASTVVVKA